MVALVCAAVCLLESHQVHGVVIGIDGKPAHAWVGTSLVISAKAPKSQIGYGKPGLATDQDGRCQPCVVELQGIADFYRAHQTQRKSFEILAIHSPDGKSSASLKESLVKLEKEYWHGKPLPFPLLFDETGKTIRAWGIESYPTTLLIDPHGKLMGHASILDLEAALQGKSVK